MSPLCCPPRWRWSAPGSSSTIPPPQAPRPGQRRLTPPPGPPPLTPPAPSGSWAAHAGTLSLGAILAALATSGYFQWETLGPFLASLAKSPSATGLLVVVAVAGALGGVFNGWLAG